MKNYDEFSKAKELIDNGNYKLALKKLKKLHLKEQDDRIIKFELAKLLLLLGDIYKARKMFMSLLNTESRYFVLLQLGRLENFVGNVEKAKEYFSQMLNTSSRVYALIELGNVEANNGNYEKAKNYYKSLLIGDKCVRKNAYIKLLMLEIQYENYENALIYLEKLIENNELSTSAIKQYQIYLNYKLNRLDPKEYIDGYFTHQVVNYNHKAAIEHIKYHLSENDEKEVHSKFNSQVDINELFNLANKQIINEKKQNYGMCEKCILDIGYVVGEFNGFETSFIEVVTICHTNNIITMYPVASKYRVQGKTYVYKND